MTTRRRAGVLALAILTLSSDIKAQPAGGASRGVSLFGGAGWMSLWDDETFLGRGLLVAGGATRRIGGHLIAEGEVAWGSHHRDAGYLAADGSQIIGTARLAYAFRSPTARTRPFASLGLSVVHSAGFLTTRSLVPGPGLFPVEAPSSRRDWSLTEPALEFAAGATIRSGDRVFVRPAFRWTSVAASSRPRSLLEPPLWMPRAEMTIGWTLGR